MVELDRDTRDKIIETHTRVEIIGNELIAGKKQFEKLDRRIRKIETIFLPVVLIIGVSANKIMELLGL